MLVCLESGRIDLCRSFFEGKLYHLHRLLNTEQRLFISPATKWSREKPERKGQRAGDERGEEVEVEQLAARARAGRRQQLQQPVLALPHRSHWTTNFVK